MTYSFLLLCVWALSANIIALFPSKRHHWPAAYMLLTIGIPLLAFVVYENGLPVIILSLAIWASVMRWPLLYGYKWIKRKLS